MKAISLGLIVVGALSIAGCAKSPDAVAAAEIDDAAYLRMSCSTLNLKEVQGQAAVESLSAKQQAAANNDALGVFFIGLPLSSMSGNDPETQLAIAKGQLNAIKSARAKKGCK